MTRLSSGESDSVPSEPSPMSRDGEKRKVEALKKEIAALKRQLKNVQVAQDLPTSNERQWQLEVGGLKAELDKERGSREDMVAARVKTQEVFLRQEISTEWAKTEAAWKERIRNERLLRLSYERVLISLGFAPSRIASDLVRISRPQPLHEDPGAYKTMNLLDIEAGLASQPQASRKGLFSYTINEVKAGMSTESTFSEVVEDFYPITDCLRVGKGRRDLLKSLSAK